MIGIEARKPHFSFWIMAVFALLWNLGGCMNFVMQMNPQSLAQMPLSHQTLAESRPLWSTIGFAVSVFGGVLGAVMLLIRKRLALPFFIASLLGAVVPTVQTLMSHDLAASPINMGIGEIIMIIVGPILAAFIFVAYTKWTDTLGWLR